MKNMRLGTQISLGFAAVLALLVVISTAAYVGLGSAVEGFNEYRGLARDANLAGAEVYVAELDKEVAELCQAIEAALASNRDG